MRSNHRVHRASQDSVINNYGRELLDLCIPQNSDWPSWPGQIHLFFPHVVDNSIFSPELMPSITHLDAFTPRSDHCPLSLDLKTNPYSPFQLPNLLKGSKELLDEYLRSNGFSADPNKSSTKSIMEYWSEMTLQQKFSDNGFIAELICLGSGITLLNVIGKLFTSIFKCMIYMGWSGRVSVWGSVWIQKKTGKLQMPYSVTQEET